MVLPPLINGAKYRTIKQRWKCPSYGTFSFLVLCCSPCPLVQLLHQRAVLALPSTPAFGTDELNKGAQGPWKSQMWMHIFIYIGMSACWCVLVIKIVAVPFCFAHTQNLYFFFFKNAKLNQNITVFREGRRHLKSSDTCRWPRPFSQYFFVSISVDLVLCSGGSSEWPWQDSWSWRLPVAAAGRPWGGSWTHTAWQDKEVTGKLCY